MDKKELESFENSGGLFVLAAVIACLAMLLADYLHLVR